MLLVLAVEAKASKWPMCMSQLPVIEKLWNPKVTVHVCLMHGCMNVGIYAECACTYVLMHVEGCG